MRVPTFTWSLQLLLWIQILAIVAKNRTSRKKPDPANLTLEGKESTLKIYQQTSDLDPPPIKLKPRLVLSGKSHLPFPETASGLGAQADFCGWPLELMPRRAPVVVLAAQSMDSAKAAEVCRKLPVVFHHLRRDGSREVSEGPVQDPEQKEKQKQLGK